MIRRLLCKLGSHKRLDLIQSFGSGKHVGCPDCGRQYAMHDGLRAFVPWDDDFKSLYEGMGYDVDTHLSAWRRVRFGGSNAS